MRRASGLPRRATIEFDSLMTILVGTRARRRAMTALKGD